MLLLKIALLPWRQAFANQLFSVLALSFLLFLSGCLFWIHDALQPVVHRLTTEQVLTAYLDPRITPEEEKTTMDRITALVGASAVRRPEVHFVGVMDFISEIKDAYPELAEQLVGLGNEISRIVPRYVSVAGQFGGGALEKIRALPEVEAAESSAHRFQHIVGAFHTVRWVALILSFGLVLAYAIGVFHLAKVNAVFQEEALRVMRLMGGSGFKLTLPAILSGVGTGLIVGLMSALAWWVSGQFFAGKMKSFSPVFAQMMGTETSLSWIFLLLLGVGVFFGGMGGALSRHSPKAR